MTLDRSNRIDLRDFDPPSRHALVFGNFAALQPGEAFELVNDHDPAPLHQQFEMRSPGLFSWRYLESGPDVWRVEIGKQAQAANKSSGSCCSGGGCCG